MGNLEIHLFVSKLKLKPSLYCWLLILLHARARDRDRDTETDSEMRILLNVWNLFCGLYPDHFPKYLFHFSGSNKLLYVPVIKLFPGRFSCMLQLVFVIAVVLFCLWGFVDFSLSAWHNLKLSGKRNSVEKILSLHWTVDKLVMHFLNYWLA